MIQQIIQVSGRAGRRGLPSSIVIQSFTEHNLEEFFEEKNFTKAAQRLNMSQPPLSMQIRELVEELGADLFIRSPHGVELTEAGLAFLNAIQPVQQRGTVDAACRGSFTRG